MQRTCTTCSAQFVITPEDIVYYRRIAVPYPRRCPRCRLQNRLAYRNERSLFAGVCAKCQAIILTLYRPEDGFTVYCQTCWWKDNWDATAYGQDIDWNRSLLEQYNEVRRRVPRLALVNMNSENSEYTNMADGNKNCYLLFAAEQNENCSYGKLVQSCKDCFDNSFVYNSELCYECINVRNCYRSIYLQDCQDSRECGYSIGLRGCSNVWLSANLHNKEYYIANQPVPANEYQARIAELTKDRAALHQCYEQWRKLNEGRTVPYASLINSPDCTGDSLSNCKRVFDSFDITDGQDCRYCTDALTPKDSYDCSFFYYQPELTYDCLSMLSTYNVKFSTFIFQCHDVVYGDQLHNSDNIMLSSCARNQHFMILNKVYSEVDYKVLLPRLVEKMSADGEYGELPAMRYSLFAYNDTVAQEYFPLTKADAIKRGLHWNDEADAAITKPFKFTAPEQVFYKTMNLPEPTEHPEVRHRRRMALRNPRKLWERQCQCVANDHGHAGECSQRFRTSYQVERPETVYCLDCYHKTMY